MKIKVGTRKSISVTATTSKTYKTHFCNYRNIFTVFSTFCLSVVGMPNHLLPSEINSQSLLLAQSNRQSYGLGFPKTASTGGGTRLVNPDDGGLRGGRSYGRPRNPIPSPPGAVTDEAEVPPAPPALRRSCWTSICWSCVLAVKSGLLQNMNTSLSRLV